MAYIKSGDANVLFSGYKTKERKRFAIFLSSPTRMSVFVRKGEEFEIAVLKTFMGRE